MKESAADCKMVGGLSGIKPRDKYQLKNHETNWHKATKSSKLFDLNFLTWSTLSKI